MSFLFSAGGSRALDAELTRLGLLDVAMERAGWGVARLLAREFPGARVLVLAGGGANGGDALVAARWLRSWGFEVRVLALEARHELTRTNRERLDGLYPEQPAEELTEAALREALPDADLLLDGLLGTGFQAPLRAPLPSLIRTVNDSGLPVLSIDLPSGLDADRADVPGEAIRADFTAAPVGLKTALVFGDAAAHAGGVEVIDLGLPQALLERHAQARQFTAREAARALPTRQADANKGTVGRVWVLGGHPGTAGAPALSGLGALRAGSGLVTVYSEAEVPLVTPELMARRVTDLLELTPDPPPDALALGMGLGPKALEVARRVLSWRLPTVIDADALQPELAGVGHGAVVWAPHPGEAARLLGTETREVVRDPLAAARALQARFGGVVILKGGPSTVACREALTVSVGGNPGMATAGMGDLLSGVVAALLGQGLDAPLAARVAVTLHARAGDLAAQEYGYGLIASDVAARLGAAWKSLATEAGAAPGSASHRPAPGQKSPC